MTIEDRHRHTPATTSEPCAPKQVGKRAAPAAGETVNSVEADLHAIEDGEPR